MLAAGRKVAALPGSFTSRGSVPDVATAAEVDRTLKDLVRRLDEAAVDANSLPESRTLAVLIKDLGVSYTAQFGAGRISALAKAEPLGDEDVRIVVGSDDLIALATGRMGVGGALLMGKLRVDAGARDLLLLRHLF